MITKQTKSPWGLHYHCPCPHSKPQPTPTSPGYPPIFIWRYSPGPCGVTIFCWIPVYVKPCFCPPSIESLFLPVLWSSCPLLLLAFKAKCFGDDCSYCHTLGSLMWGSELSYLWENLCDIFFRFMDHSPSAYEIWSCHESVPPFISLWLLSFLM